MVVLLRCMQACAAHEPSKHFTTHEGRLVHERECLTFVRIQRCGGSGSRRHRSGRKGRSRSGNNSSTQGKKLHGHINDSLSGGGNEVKEHRRQAGWPGISAMQQDVCDRDPCSSTSLLLSGLKMGLLQTVILTYLSQLEQKVSRRK